MARAVRQMQPKIVSVTGDSPAAALAGMVGGLAPMVGDLMKAWNGAGSLPQPPPPRRPAGAAGGGSDDLDMALSCLEEDDEVSRPDGSMRVDNYVAACARVLPPPHPSACRPD